MPSYDVHCGVCDYSDILVSKIADLPSWDLAAVCPACKAPCPQFGRVIKTASAGRRGFHSQSSRSMVDDQKKHFAESGTREAAREIVKRGDFEGF